MLRLFYHDKNFKTVIELHAFKWVHFLLSINYTAVKLIFTSLGGGGSHLGLPELLSQARFAEGPL